MKELKFDRDISESAITYPLVAEDVNCYAPDASDENCFKAKIDISKLSVEPYEFKIRFIADDDKQKDSRLITMKISDCEKQKKETKETKLF